MLLAERALAAARDIDYARPPLFPIIYNQRGQPANGKARTDRSENDEQLDPNGY